MKRRIEKTKYFICADAYSMWLEEEYENKKGKLATRRASGYCGSYESLLDHFTAKRIMAADKKTVKGFLREIAAAEREARKLAKGLGRILDEKAKEEK